MLLEPESEHELTISTLARWHGSIIIEADDTVRCLDCGMASADALLLNIKCPEWEDPVVKFAEILQSTTEEMKAWQRSFTELYEEMYKARHA